MRWYALRYELVTDLAVRSRWRSTGCFSRVRAMPGGHASVGCGGCGCCPHANLAIDLTAISGSGNGNAPVTGGGHPLTALTATGASSSTVVKRITLYASAHHSATHLAFRSPRTVSCVSPR